MHTSPYVPANLSISLGLGMGLFSAYGFLNGTAGVEELVAAVFAPGVIAWSISFYVKCKLSAMINDEEDAGVTNNMETIKDITNCDRNKED